MATRNNAVKIPPEELKTIPRCLVIMPFRESWSNDFYDAIVDVMRNVQVNVFRVDLTQRIALKLPEDIEKQVQTADIVLAECTTQNPNVHIEIGLALANEKDLILCTQKKEDICAHLSDYYYLQYDPSETGLEELSRQMRLRIIDCLKEQRVAKRAVSLASKLELIYDVKCYSERKLIELENVFSAARQHIDILTTNLDWLFKEVDEGQPTYWQHIEKTVKRNENLQLRVLTLNPESQIAADRARQLGFSVRKFRAQLSNSLDQVGVFEAAIPGDRVEVRLYSELPTQITFRIDDRIYTCIVGQPMQSRYYPVLEFDIDNVGVKEAFLAHFLNVWKDADQPFK